MVICVHEIGKRRRNKLAAQNILNKKKKIKNGKKETYEEEGQEFDEIEKV